MNAVKLFFSSKLVQLLVFALLVVVVILGFYREGVRDGSVAWKEKYDRHVATEAERQRQLLERSNSEIERLRLEQDAIVTDLRQKLDEAEGREAPVKVIIREVPRYVTQKADADCPITAGFQWVYNSSLVLPTDAELARSRPEDVDAPTGITLSGVATVAAENNTECAQRGEIIEQWNTWYLQNKRAFERLQLAAPP